jgi:hypothetical protein
VVVLSESEAEKAAAKLPLPSFDDEKDEIACATDWAASCKRHVACVVLGLSDNHLRSDWRRYRKSTLEGRRFTEWKTKTSAYWDAHRGAYVVHFPKGTGERDVATP